MGAVALQRLASHLEQAIKAGETDLEDALASLEQAYAGLARAIREHLGQETPAAGPAAPVSDWPRVRTLVARLREYLGQDDLQSITLFNEHAALLTAALGRLGEALRHHVEDFAFDEALTVLEQAIRDIPQLRPSDADPVSGEESHGA